ncbi:hypothetical protein BG011_004389 [Mortierella polycephala]|uniref:F-box domain-containing protein n=1 Tax=Mortierella polycephala TaxID=41804 RepID=A0A9P6QCI3_9FUNG|nr:hypothetical protein BG011_004389 [Mortierella polycephala]
MEMALDLPEILLLIGMYLDHRELTQCIRVCAAWHASFVHFIWSTVEVIDASGEPYPAINAIIKHRTLIKDLTMWTDYSTIESLTQTYPRLERLSIISDAESGARYVASGALLSDLLDLNPTIMTLEMNDIEPSDFVWDMSSIDTLPCLKQLDIYDSIFPKEKTALQSLYRTCCRLHTLAFHYTPIPQSFIDICSSDIYALKGLRKLELDVPESPNIHHQLQFIQLCIGLVSLDWTLSCDVDAVILDSMTCSLAELWPTLERLKLRNSEISDKNLASILACMKRIKALDVRLTGFGDLSFQVLRPHFGTLEELELVQCVGVTDAMICEILQSCPKLRELILGRVRVRELGLLSPQSRPWKCLSLRRLQLEFVFESRASTPSSLPTTEDKGSKEEGCLMQLVYERLSHLTQLEVLNVGHDLLDGGEATLPGSSEGHLQFNLSKGLGQLCRLKRMWLVNTNETRQDMNKQDVEWMLEHWKGFKEFYGSANEDPEINRALKIMIYKRNNSI